MKAAHTGEKGRIPVVDLFAGPGGLAEGFSAFSGSTAGHPFRVALSIEKNADAHATLELRSFFRSFSKGDVPEAYFQVLRGELGTEQLYSEFPREAAKARAEAWKAELGVESRHELGRQISAAVSGNEPWVLVGGPPCQAYSLVGRSRNRGTRGYVPELDKRQTLYVEYLQVLADHAPSVFVMENVKGLLSAHLEGNALFERIREDLAAPTKALRRERRPTSRRSVRYTLYAFSSSGLPVGTL